MGETVKLAKVWPSVTAAAALVLVTGCVPIGQQGDAESGGEQESRQTVAPSPQSDDAEEGETEDEDVVGGVSETDEADGGEADEREADEDEDLTEDSDRIVAEVGDPVEIPGCEPGEDRTVTLLEDVIVEEVLHPGTESQVIEVDGETVEIPGAPEVLIPERVGQAGCVVEYEAPGGCLPTVEISSAHIPEVVLPERVLPEVVLPDGTVLEEVVQEAVTLEAVEMDGVVAEEVCQADEDEADPGDYIWAAYRWAEYRWAEYQWAEYQWSERRWSESGEDWTVPAMTLETVTADTLKLSTVMSPTEKLETYRLDDAEHTERTDDDDRTAYITEGDVLFDPDERDVRAEAEGDLRAIAEDIAARDDDYVITVEGHTDDIPTEEFEDNQELSELRAESVRDWLIEEADLDADVISSEGFGEDVPRTDNDTEEGRELNRRVVITVSDAQATEDGDADYEIGEDAEDAEDDDAGEEGDQ